MKVTIVLAGLAVALAASQHGFDGLEPAWMFLSGASLLMLASVVRRQAP